MANRGASIRIPRDAEKSGRGYMEVWAVPSGVQSPVVSLVFLEGLKGCFLRGSMRFFMVFLMVFYWDFIELGAFS